MDKAPDCADVVLPLRRERQGLARQAAHPLPQRVVEPFDATGLPAVFANRAMSFRREDTDRGVPKITVTNSTLAIDRWQRFLQLTRRRGITRSDSHPDYFPCVAVESQPHPFLVVFIADKRPQFVALDSQSALFLIGHAPPVGRGDSSR